MNCLVRIYPQSDPKKRWSITTEYDGTSCRLVVKRCDISGGWDEPFSVCLRNIAGSSINYEVAKSVKQTLKIPINPFIGLSFATPRAEWKIPPIIFQTWRAGEITPEMKAARQSFLDQENYKYICWNDDECHKFLELEYGERYAKAYALLVPGAYRADFWRYCVLYRFGGVYADAKTTCLRPLDEIIRPTDDLVVVRDVPITCLLNGFIACQPGHPLLKLAMETTLENIEARSYCEDPLDICGPHMFGRMFCKLLSVSEDCLNLGPGYTNTIQMLGRSKDKKYIISPEGEPLLEKEYDSYYKKDINVRFHYPNLWASKMVYRDQLPDPKK